MPAEAQFPELAASVNEVAGANLLSARDVQSKEVAAGHMTVELIDGASYKGEATSNSGMFNITNCVLTKNNSKMTAVITLSGKIYSHLYIGSEEDAKKASANNYEG